MHEGIDTLTERERETLRLLLAGHDAKSAARHLGLSIHTVNERLRDARRKLGVTSSRAAARMLADAEREDPKKLGDRFLRVATDTGERATTASPNPFSNRSSRLAWVGGGIAVMSLLIVAALLLARAPADGGQAAASPGAAAASTREAASAGAGAARAWVALLDAGRWDEAWRAAGALFQAGMAEQRMAPTLQPVRQPLGRVVARAFRSVTATTALPGAPVGHYEIVQFTTDFAAKPGAVETVVLARQGADWKVDGYFIR